MVSSDFSGFYTAPSLSFEAPLLDAPFQTGAVDAASDAVPFSTLLETLTNVKRSRMIPDSQPTASSSSRHPPLVRRSKTFTQQTLDGTANMALTETSHQHLQRQLAASPDRTRRGGPMEQPLSAPQRMRHCRSELIHSSMQDPLKPYKTLIPLRQEWPNENRRFHLNHGISVVDQDTIVVSAKDKLLKTRQGLMRQSSGTITYSHSHLTKLELDVTVLAQIVNEGVPGGGHAWTLKKLERVFRERTGRSGTWVYYEVPFRQFLLLFPKTFDVFGPDASFIRLRCPLRPRVMDNPQDAIVRLACARERGVVEQHPPIEGCLASTRPASRQEVAELPKLKKNRLKAVFQASGPLVQEQERPETRRSASPLANTQ